MTNEERIERLERTVVFLLEHIVEHTPISQDDKARATSMVDVIVMPEHEHEWIERVRVHTVPGVSVVHEHCECGHNRMREVARL